jgi:GntR family transcriptional regulator, transcriptional repressor for pyruvate dehydrogenase complex
MHQTRSNRLKPAPSLTEQVTATLRREITGGMYEKGDLMPSEQSLALNFGVSRAVIREAVSRLKADGLVVSRQGRGAYVASTVAQQGFQISGDSADDHNGIHKILELRMGVEVEAAGLAAANRTAKDLLQMQEALEAVHKSVSVGSVPEGVEADLRFHQAICAATENPHFDAFVSYLSPFLRGALAVTRRNSTERLKRINEVDAEHQAIYNAIAAGDPEAARLAARRHITNSMKRLAASSPDNADGAENG